MTQDEGGDACREQLESLLISQKAELEVLKPVGERLQSAEQRLENKTKQLEKAVSRAKELDIERKELEENITLYNEERDTLATALQVLRSEDLILGVSETGDKKQVIENFLFDKGGSEHQGIPGKDDCTQ